MKTVILTMSVSDTGPKLVTYMFVLTSVTLSVERSRVTITVLLKHHLLSFVCI